jgi:short-subunit dehydrogenase
MQKFFQGKIVLITGASSGIGKALREALSLIGAIVYNADIQIPANDIENVSYFPLDVRDFDQFQNVFQSILQKHQRIDILINNAGIGIAGEAQDLSISEWKKVLDINLMGVVNGSKIAYDIMVKQGFGHIVNMASMSALISFPLAVPYATAKHGVLGLSKSLRAEGKALGVKVTAICPGFVESSLYENAIKSHTNTEKIKSTIPFPILSTEKAVGYILKGIIRNQAVVIFPFYTKLALWLERIFPNLLNKFVLQKTITNFRESKT